MKIPKEYILLFIIGAFLLAYILDLVVDPLNIKLLTPYAFFNPEIMFLYPFSTTSIFIKALAIFISPLWLMSFFEGKGFAKPSILLVLASLIQLYAIQDISLVTRLIPMEWSLSFSLAGAALLVPTVWFFIKAAIFSAHSNLTSIKMTEAIKLAQEEAKKESSEKE